MSNVLTINGKNLLPIREVVGRTTYSRDYIARLAREGAITGVQVGRQWFIDHESLLQFAHASELEQQIRRRHLSHERRRERDTAAAVARQWTAVSAHPRYSARQAVLKSALIVVAGLCTGVMLHAAPVATIVATVSQKAQAPLALWRGTSSVSNEEVMLSEVPLFVFSNEEALHKIAFVPEAEVRAFPQNGTGILLLPVGASATTAEVVAAMFSDPVEVRYEADGMGTVALRGVPSSTPLSFVTVPVMTDERSSIPSQFVP